MTAGTRRRKAKETTVSLGSDLRIGRAREAYNALSDNGKYSQVVIDASDVSKVDAAGIQLLAAAIVRYRTAGTEWRWHNLSPALSSAVDLLGMGDALELKK